MCLNAETLSPSQRDTFKMPPDLVGLGKKLACTLSSQVLCEVGRTV